MIQAVEIEHFKSIEHAKLMLGQFNVIIGENGSGKSNLLEAIGYVGAAAAGKPDHEFLASRGIRTATDRLMRPAFSDDSAPTTVKVTLDGTTYSMHPPKLEITHKPDLSIDDFEDQLLAIKKALKKILADSHRKIIIEMRGLRQKEWQLRLKKNGLTSFLIFSPENSALRTFQREGQILPLGINGEGQFAHLRTLTQSEETACLTAIQERLALLDWFGGLKIPQNLGIGERRLDIIDRFLPEQVLDQRSVNEGFLFLLFYFTLFISPKTPQFFAIDNIDASLNPKLCARLTQDLVELSKTHQKQVIVTTHNPAILDGLDLTDDQQRLFVASRTADGATRVRRVQAPVPIGDDPAVRLSEAFMRGFLGGLPRHF